jgi:zinc transporter, ZIP family
MTVTETVRRAVPGWVRVLAPLALVTVLVGGLLMLDPLRRPAGAPPIERLAIERTVLELGRIELSVRNDGPDPVHIAQVQVNRAFWQFTAADAELGRLERTVVEILYPWEEGLPLEVTLVTTTGVTVAHQVEAAVPTPLGGDATLPLLGLLIGIVPVGIGLAWLPVLRAAGEGWRTFVLALTVGLLGFLLVDTVAEGLDLGAATGAALDGLALFSVGAVAAATGLAWLGAVVSRASRSSGTSPHGLRLAYLIAAGIGLHNLGEGLAVGAAVASGNAALGTSLVVGFALHNATEGLAIAGPLGGAGERVGLGHLVGLVLLAGGPAIPGAVAGGVAVQPALAALVFGLAAGAIAQVLGQLGSGLLRSGTLGRAAGATGILAGFVLMYVTAVVAGPT